MAKLNNPYRKGSLNFKVFGALLASKVPSTMAIIAKRTRMPQETVARVLNALRNPLHNSVARRAGVSLQRDEKSGGYIARKTKAQPNAKRARKAARKPKKKSRQRKRR